MTVGQVVIVRPDLEEGRYGANTAVEAMLKYRGKMAVIASERDTIRGGKQYSLKIDSYLIPWYWTPEMLIPADNEIIEEFYHDI